MGILKNSNERLTINPDPCTEICEYNDDDELEENFMPNCELYNCKGCDWCPKNEIKEKYRVERGGG